MLEDQYSSPVADRIRGLWLGPAIEKYVDWLAERQHTSGSIRVYVQTVIKFDTYASRAGAMSWDELPDLVTPFVEHGLGLPSARTVKSIPAARSNLRAPVESMLQLVIPGFERPSRTNEDNPFPTTVPGFFDYLREERGLRPNTLRVYRHYLRTFEAYIQNRGVDHLSQLSPEVISDFVTDRSRTLGSRSMWSVCHTMRGLLRYALREGHISSDLARAIPRGRNYRQKSVPRAISWEDAGRLLAVVDRDSLAGCRDYAMLLLLLTYGLRAREVAHMSLDDIDWQRSILRIPSRKGGHSTVYPFAEAVGSAIIDYLQRGRPKVDGRQLFRRCKAPFSHLDHSCVSSRASKYLKRAGITVPRAGSHTLRHTCVQRLVEADMPFKNIGDYVGHSSPASTLVYAKVALHKLRPLVIGEAEEML
ncbi:tyrosine-type recombinase/integrase [Brevundimonas sp.]|uniref:tyrosine-type recombinase/integrase n=1 Tax=Brevundimonas sp. TaxID=1871086 RepID=UPI003F6F0CFB